MTPQRDLHFRPSEASGKGDIRVDDSTTYQGVLGLGAERLGSADRVHAEDFLRLCENQHPCTGKTLTQ